MRALRTPDECFSNLEGYPFKPNYLNVPDGEGGELRIHYVDEGPAASPPVLCMHGEPSWSYLYRRMIPIFTGAGLRAVAPDLVGFGKSDKPTELSDYTCKRHVDWMHAFLNDLDLKNITLVCQDWGGVIGLRLVAEQPERFARIVASNTGLPDGGQMNQAFLDWQKYSREVPIFKVGKIIKNGCVRPMSEEVQAAYDAPFPDDSYKAGARIFPSLVPTSKDDPAVEDNRRAWQTLSRFEKPVLTVFADSDPITRGGDALLQERIPGAKGQPHTTIKNAGHFVQEDAGEEFAEIIVDFIRKTS